MPFLIGIGIFLLVGVVLAYFGSKSGFFGDLANIIQWLISKIWTILVIGIIVIVGIGLVITIFS